MSHQYATIGDTVYFYFASNDTSGSGGDGATPLFDVREAGAAASAAPLLSGTPTLLTHANYPAGCHEVAVAATVGNGFAADDVFSVFCTIAIDSQNPSGFIGSCKLTPLATEAKQDIIDTNVDTLVTRIVGTLAAGTHNPASAAQIAVLSDWIDGGRLDLLLDAIKVVTDAQTAISPADFISLIFNRSLAAHQTALTAGRALTLGGVPIAETTATGTPTTSSIQLTAGSTVDGFYEDSTLTILSGPGAGQARPIATYTGATKTCTFDEAFTVAPVATNIVAVRIDHVHPVSEIQAGLATTAELDKVPKSDGTVAHNATALAAITADVVGDAVIAELTTQGDTNETKLDTLTTNVATVDTVVDNLNLGIIYGAAATGTLSTTQATSDLTGYADDQLIGRVIIWTSGACEGEGTDITDYASASGLLTFTALTTAPSDADTFKIV